MNRRTTGLRRRAAEGEVIASGDAARLSRLLFESRELIDTWNDAIEDRTGKRDTNSRRVRDEIDAYRAEQGWSPNSFGGED